jgi:hypothetical protein
MCQSYPFQVDLYLPLWRFGLLQCPIKGTSLNCFRHVEHHQAAVGIKCQRPIKRRGRGPHGLVEVFVALNDGTADITRHCMAVCTCHFVALLSASKRQHPIDVQIAYSVFLYKSWTELVSKIRGEPQVFTYPSDT